jgi:hypothetical protein
MPTFVVYSDLPATEAIIAMWKERASRDLINAEVKFKTAYCCTPDRKVICEFEGPDKRSVTEALTALGMPFTVIMEATKVSSFES